MKSPTASSATHVDQTDAMLTDAVIQLDHVTVRYTVPRERILSFKEYAIRFLQGQVEYEAFRALDDVNLTILGGEVFGLVGRNGAGKSTLLKVISRVLRPTEGRVRLHGFVAPLLQLGAGFHSELTGRENIYLNGALLGYTKSELDELFQDIVTFADVGPFIDAPLRTYSSGMTARLGFAVATATPPDILLVDELLSVGDAEFQAKCTARIENFRASGTTVVLVTHALATIRRLCDRAAWLDHGVVQATGPVDEVLGAYEDGTAS